MTSLQEKRSTDSGGIAAHPWSRKHLWTPRWTPFNRRVKRYVPPFAFLLYIELLTFVALCDCVIRCNGVDWIH